MGYSIEYVYKLVDKYSGPAGKMGKGANALKGALKGTTVALGAMAAVAGVAIKKSSEFETSMAKVSTLVDTNTVNMKAQADAVLALSSETGKSATEIAEAQYQAISAGIDVANSVEFVGTAVKAAEAGFTDTATAVDGLSSVLNAYSLGADQANVITGQLLATQNFGKTTFGEMAASIGSVIPTAAALNMKTEELFGSVAALTKQGIPTASAMTGMKAAMSNIIKPSSEATKMAQQLGIDFSAAAMETKGWAGFLADIQKKTGGSQEKMAKLFGSVEALNTVMALGAGDGKILTDAIAAVGDSAGTTDEAYAKMTNTLGFRFEKLKNRVTNAMIKLGDSLAPAVNALLDTVDAMDFSAMDSLIGTVGILVADLLPVALDLLSGLMPVVQSLLPVISSLLPVVSVLVGDLLTAILPLVESIAGVFEPLVPIVSKIAGMISEIMKPALGAINKIFIAVLPVVNQLLVFVSGILDALMPIFNILTPILNLVLGIIQPLMPLLNLILYPTLLVMTKYITVLTKIIETVITLYMKIHPIFSILQEIGAKWDYIKSSFMDGGLIAGFKALGGVILSALVAPFEEVLNLASKIPGLSKLATGADKLAGARAALTGVPEPVKAPSYGMPTTLRTETNINLNNNTGTEMRMDYQTRGNLGTNMRYAG